MCRSSQPPYSVLSRDLCPNDLRLVDSDNKTIAIKSQAHLNYTQSILKCGPLPPNCKVYLGRKCTIKKVSSAGHRYENTATSTMSWDHPCAPNESRLRRPISVLSSAVVGHQWEAFQAIYVYHQASYRLRIIQQVQMNRSCEFMVGNWHYIGLNFDSRAVCICQAYAWRVWWRFKQKRYKLILSANYDHKVPLVCFLRLWPLQPDRCVPRRPELRCTRA